MPITSYRLALLLVDCVPQDNLRSLQILVLRHAQMGNIQTVQEEFAVLVTHLAGLVLMFTPRTALNVGLIAQTNIFISANVSWIQPVPLEHTQMIVTWDAPTAQQVWIAALVSILRQGLSAWSASIIGTWMPQGNVISPVRVTNTKTTGTILVSIVMQLVALVQVALILPVLDVKTVNIYWQTHLGVIV